MFQLAPGDYVVGHKSFTTPQTAGDIFMTCGVARKSHITFSSLDLKGPRPCVDQFLSGVSKFDNP